MQKQLFTKTRWLVTIILLITFGVPKMWGATGAITALNLFTGSKTVTGNTTFYAVFADYAE